MKKGKIIWYLLVIIPIVLLILGYIFPNTFFSSQEQVRIFIQSFGTWAPIIFILIQIFQVVITPLNHYAVGIVGGFVFGTWKGFIYNWTGRVIGTLIAFWIARKIGRRIIKHVIKKKNLNKYDNLFEKGNLVLFAMYFLPLFPDDELSYLAGVSSINPRIFTIIMAIGHIGGSLSLAYIGSGISLTDPLFIVLSLASLIVGVLGVCFYRKINKAGSN